VHGLGSNPDTTWLARPLNTVATLHRDLEVSASQNKPVNWVTDLLPDEIPLDVRQRSRFYFHNHDSYIKRDALNVRMRHVSDDLLNGLQHLLSDSESRKY
jgi:hypothetical protein